MSAAVTNGVRPESVLSKPCFASHAVSGHAAIPDNKANQPFVNRQGPLSVSNIVPPPAAKIVHAQAADKPYSVHLFSFGCGRWFVHSRVFFNSMRAHTFRQSVNHPPSVSRLFCFENLKYPHAE